MFAVEIHRFTLQQAPPDLSKFSRGFIALGVIEEHAVACQLLWIAAGHQVK